MFIRKKMEVAVNPELSELDGAQSVKTVLRSKRGLSTSIPEALGALVLGVMVIGGLAIGIGAAYNYGQDSTAKSTLDAVKSAQVLQHAKTGSFGTKTQLQAGDDPALPTDSGKWDVAATATNYCAVSKSGSTSGTTYWITAKSGKILETLPTPAAAGVTCPTIAP